MNNNKTKKSKEIESICFYRKIMVLDVLCVTCHRENEHYTNGYNSIPRAMIYCWCWRAFTVSLYKFLYTVDTQAHMRSLPPVRTLTPSYVCYFYYLYIEYEVWHKHIVLVFIVCGFILFSHSHFQFSMYSYFCNGTHSLIHAFSLSLPLSLPIHCIIYVQIKIE